LPTTTSPLTPAEAGVQGGLLLSLNWCFWIPACAGMSGECVAVRAKCFAGMIGVGGSAGDHFSAHPRA
jgi:hypothetical protein